MSKNNNTHTHRNFILIFAIITLVLIAIIILFFTIERYHYNHFWDSRTKFHAVDYYSKSQAEQLNIEDYFIKNKENEYGEFLSGQTIYKDDMVILLEIYRQSSNKITCVIQLELEKDNLRQYEYQCSIFHETNFVIDQRTLKIQSIDSSGNLTLIDEQKGILHDIMQFMLSYPNIKVLDYNINKGDNIRFTYITQFYINCDEEKQKPEIKVNMDVISKYKYKELASYELSKQLYIEPWDQS